jgi:DhnA family fructose-bisphosphate aldolase class Ia
MNHKQLCEPDFGKKENYTIILPIDQGVEHGPHAAFYSSDHPEMMDVVLLGQQHYHSALPIC